MNKNNNVADLLGYLEQEINLVKQLNVLLAEEKAVLLASEFEKLDAMATLKQELSEQLEQSAQQRLNLLHESMQHNSSDPMQNFLQLCSNDQTTAINLLNNSLAHELTICRESNAVNGQVIASNLHSRQEIVSILSGATDTELATTYNASGTIQSTGENSHHQEA